MKTNLSKKPSVHQPPLIDDDQVPDLQDRLRTLNRKRVLCIAGIVVSSVIMTAGLIIDMIMESRSQAHTSSPAFFLAEYAMLLVLCLNIMYLDNYRRQIHDYRENPSPKAWWV